MEPWTLTARWGIHDQALRGFVPGNGLTVE